MEKIITLPGMAIFVLSPARTILEQSLGREDVPQDLQDQVAAISEGLTGIIEHAKKAHCEIDPHFDTD
jgi:anti-sigma regulatory factor (Ser/Thr protein kinase)